MEELNKQEQVASEAVKLKKDYPYLTIQEAVKIAEEIYEGDKV